MIIFAGAFGEAPAFVWEFCEAIIVNRWSSRKAEIEYREVPPLAAINATASSKWILGEETPLVVSKTKSFPLEKRVDLGKTPRGFPQAFL